MRLSRLPCAVGTRFWLLKPVWLKHSVAIWSRATISRLMLWKSACLAPEKATTEFPISLVFFQVSTIFGDQTDPSLGTCPHDRARIQSLLFSRLHRGRFVALLTSCDRWVQRLNAWRVVFSKDGTSTIETPLSLCDFYMQTTCSVACQKLLSRGRA